MSLLPFMKQKATEKGLKNCPHCGVPDIFYALNGTCMECNKPIDRHSKPKTFQFALELFNEFIEKFDNLTPRETKQPAIDYFIGLIATCKNENKLPSNESIIRLQSFINNMGSIGGDKIGGSITVQNGQPSLQLLKNYQPSGDPMARIKSLGAVVAAIQYIQGLSVTNEFVLDPKTTPKAASITALSSKKPTSKTGSGCVISLAIISTVFIGLTLLITIFIL